MAVLTTTAKDEEERLAELARYGVLDTPPERELDDIAAMAAEICGVPVGLVSLVDRDRQFFKARVGVDVTETPRDVSLCQHAILGEHPLVVPDATLDPRFRDHPPVTGDLGLRFYAGVPLITPAGHALGTLCVIDREPHELDDRQLRLLALLSRQVMTRLELRRCLSLSETALAETQAHKARVEEAVERQKDLVQEMAHRVKNTLTIVQSIVTQTLRQADTAEEARDAIEARLSALGRAQNALTRAQAGEVRIHEVLKVALAPHRGMDHPGTFALDGPDIDLGSRQALGLSLGIHELATNAAKYGALSEEGGTVAIAWSLNDGAFHLEWREHGGPAVAVPERTGFGSRLVERIMASYFEGQAKLHFEPDGLICRLHGKATTQIATA